jgi:uncharacterized membrane protein YedE/YeeE
MELDIRKSSSVAVAASGETIAQLLYTLLVGTFFGVVLVKSEVVSWFRIQKMFRFEEAHMYLIIASAVVVGLVSVYLIKKFTLRTVEDREIQVETKPFQKGVILGGIIFGMGWALTGACPGPIYAQIGSGEYVALVTLGGALGGTYLYALVRSRLPY